MERNSKLRVAFHTLGCKVNQYETEAMASAFRRAGFEVVDEQALSDVYIINTCTVTSIADRKSRQFIRRAKNANPDSIVAVTGCYAQTSPKQVADIEGVDIVAGANEKHNVLNYVIDALGNREAVVSNNGAASDKHRKIRVEVRKYEDLSEFVEMGTVSRTEGRTRAYIKIQEGCERFCSYCVIPYARGPIRSRNIEDILTEAEALIDAGYKELVLTGINTAQYGMEGIDLYSDSPFGGSDEPFGVEKVIAAVNALPGYFRIRLSSLEPAVVNADYVKRLFRYDKLCHHLHMSAQSGNDRVLKAMNRPYSRQQYTDMVKALREFDPCYGISTDIIVGFPGETDKEFDDSVRLIEESCFCKTHAFRYSQRPFTKAAGMAGQVHPQIKKKRCEILEAAADRVAKEFYDVNLEEAARGRMETVLIEEIIQKPDMYFVGYTGNYIKTYIPYCENIELNTFVPVKFEKIMDDGMLGHAVLE